MISRASGSGKTYFVKTLLQFLGSVGTPKPEEVIWCYGMWQSSYQDISDTVIFREGLPIIQSEGNKRRLVIVGDLMNKADKSLTDLFTKGSQHKNISVIHIVPNLFRKNKQQRT